MLTHRLATEDDLPAMGALMTRAIEHLQDGFLSPEQVRASHKVMGLDTQLVKDRTYFLVEEDGRLAGCGGWLDTAPRMPEGWPGCGPVVVSTPGVSWRSGWPAVLLCSWRKFFSSDIGRS